MIVAQPSQAVATLGAGQRNRHDYGGIKVVMKIGGY